ncbi:hypothetical protein [Neptunomonas japonica]|uniref:hypothetical protein n=1 Tax=Neptunomonas japonica TaxID=417574 RepID=UPI0004076C7A|nr:hypothetical protein [Neptunomonas japonica]
MSIEQGLLVWLQAELSLDAYWLERPEGVKRCCVYRCISPGTISGNLKSPGIKADTYSITVYHDDPEKGRIAADIIRTKLNDFNGDLGSYPVQHIQPTGGFDQILNTEAGIKVYQFNRDLLINH